MSTGILLPASSPEVICYVLNPMCSKYTIFCLKLSFKMDKEIFADDLSSYFYCLTKNAKLNLALKLKYVECYYCKMFFKSEFKS